VAVIDWFGDSTTDASTVTGWFTILLVGGIVLFDSIRSFSMQRQVPRLGELANGGWAWSTDIESELNRNWAHLLALGVIFALPWTVQDLFVIPTIQIVLLDLLLLGMVVLQVLPKRYAVTRQHLYVDGFRHDWHRLRYRGWRGRHRIVLQRRGWGPYAPLPLGGSHADLEQAALRIDAASSGRWAELLDAIAAEE